MVRQSQSGESSGWHTHPGVEVSTMIAGNTELRIAGAPPRLLRAGETVTIPRGAVHEARATGGASRIMITLIVDKGAPLRTAVPAPAP